MTPSVTSSGALAVGATVVTTRRSMIAGVTITAAAATSTLIITDTASSKVLANVSAVAGTTEAIAFNFPVDVLSGITATVAGAAAVGIVYYTLT